MDHQPDMRTALFGYSHFTRHCARALQQLGHRVELFCPVADQAFLEQYGLAHLDLPVHWFDNVQSPELLDALDAFEPDLVLSIIFNHRIPESVIRRARVAALNVHPAPLPAIRTASVWFWPLRLGLRQTEVCVHHLTQNLDEGPVILRHPFSLDRYETQGTHAARLDQVGPRVMKALASLLQTGPVPPGEPQGHGHWYPPVRETDLWLDLSDPAESIRNLVRASNPWHPARARFRGYTLGIHEVHCPEVPDQTGEPGEPGELRVHRPDAAPETPELWMSCGDRSIQLTVVAVPGEGVFSGGTFAMLYGVEDGERLMGARPIR